MLASVTNCTVLYVSFARLDCSFSGANEQAEIPTNDNAENEQQGAYTGHPKMVDAMSKPGYQSGCAVRHHPGT